MESHSADLRNVSMSLFGHQNVDIWRQESTESEDNDVYPVDSDIGAQTRKAQIEFYLGLYKTYIGMLSNQFNTLVKT